MRRGLVLCTGLLGTSTAAAAAGATARLAWQLHVDVEQPADLLLVVASGMLALLLCRVTGCAAVLLVAAAAPRAGRAGRLALALSPRLLRPLVVAALGIGLGLGGAGAASASSGSAGTGSISSAAHPSVPSAELGVGWTPDGTDRPALVSPGWVAPSPRVPTKAAADVHLVSSGRSAPAADGTVVVRRGDCLWTLAARQLGGEAGDAQVSDLWHRWWATNRATIGDDPDVLVPGTRLVVPAATADLP